MKPLKNQNIDSICPHCNSHKIIRDGTRNTTMGKKKKWQCKESKKSERRLKFKGGITK